MQQIQGPKQECFDVLGKRLASFEHRDTILSDDLASRLQTGPVAGFPQMMVVQVCTLITGGSSKK